jgi:hypothetical protein
MRARFVNGMVDTGARVVVIPVGVAQYRDPSAAQLGRGRRRFDDLPAVDRDLERLAQLFASEPYRRNGFAVVPPVSGTAGEITDHLNRIVEDLAEVPGRTVLVLWSGHGETPNGGELRLATQESIQPMTAADGFSPAELVNKLAATGARSLCLVLDVCQAGAAGGNVAAAAAQRFRENPEARFHGLAALFSAQAFEQAQDGVFAGVLVRVLQEGPSAQARARIAERGWGGFTHNRLLTMRELEEVVEVEFEVMQDSQPFVQAPAGLHFGRAFGMFPNPLYQADAPPLGVEVARRRWMRQQDFDAHFLPKARGLEPGEEGWAFSGREAVSREIVAWLGEPAAAPPPSLYVVTGSGGTGKSAVLGRMVALSDTKFRATAVAAGAAAARETVPDEGSFGAALHLRNLDVPATAQALSELLGVAPPQADSVDAWTQLQPERLPGDARPVTIALDALDEAVEPAAVVDRLIRPLAQRGWRFLIGSRPSAAARGAARLLERLGPAQVRDLDAESATQGDIARYVEQRLLHAPASPYATHPQDAAAIAEQLARRAEGRFLFARLAVSGLLHRERIAPEALDGATGATIGATIGDVLARDVADIDARFAEKFGRNDRGARNLLGALAWAHGNGLPERDGVWTIVAGVWSAEAAQYADEHVQWLLREAGRYVVESGDGEQAVYRLFHESLNEHFRAGHDAAETGVRIASALSRDVALHGGWDHANPYLVRHLLSYYRSAHADLERLCTNPWYLRRALQSLGVDTLAELIAGAHRRYRLTAIEALAKSLRRARVALSRDPDQLAAQLHARLADERWGAIKGLLHQLPRVAPRYWLRSRGATLGWRASLQTMQTFGAKVRALAFGSIDGESVIAVGAGTEVILWNPRMGSLTRRFDNDGLRVTGLDVGVVDERAVVAVGAGYDNRLVLRDAYTGAIVGEPMPCAAGEVFLGKADGREVVVAPAGSGKLARTIDGRAPEWTRNFVAMTIGCVGEHLVDIASHAGEWRVAKLGTGESVGVPVPAPSDAGVVAVGEFDGAPVLAVANWLGTIRVVDLRNGQPLGAEMRAGFNVRTLVVGELDGECIVAAGNDSDNEGGYVAIRQPLVSEGASMPLGPDLVHKRILGVGLSTRTGARLRDLVLIIEGAGAVDPVFWEMRATRPDEGAAIELVSGAWEVPAIAEQSPLRIPGGHGAGRGFVLRRDRPKQWPVTCEAWATIAGTLMQARGSYAGTAWIYDPASDSIVAGPFRDVADEMRIWKGIKGGGRRDEPAGAVALGPWSGRAVVAIAHLGHVDVFDVATGALLGAPATGKSEIVAVALGEADGHCLLATGSAGGAVTIWQGPEMTRVASITLDDAVSGIWLARDVVVARVSGDRFHVFDLVASVRDDTPVARP